MTDETLPKLETLHERLRWARKRANHRSAAAFARQHDITEVTYQSHENGNRKFDELDARRYGTLLGVPWIWLLYGQDSMRDVVVTHIEQTGPIELPAPAQNVRSADDVGRLPPLGYLPRDVPVWGTAAGSAGKGSFFLENSGTPVDWVARLPGIANARDVYALYIENDSMWPRYMPGELVYVDPHRHVKPNDFVIIQQKTGRSETPQAFIKLLQRRTEKEYVLEQFNPKATIKLPRNTVMAAHYVLTTKDLAA